MQHKNSTKPRRRWHRKQQPRVAGARWRRDELAQHWRVTERTVDRRREYLGEPQYNGRIPSWTNAQRENAEHAMNAAAANKRRAAVAHSNESTTNSDGAAA
jgi:hypothetical protein